MADTITAQSGQRPAQLKQEGTVGKLALSEDEEALRQRVLKHEGWTISDEQMMWRRIKIKQLGKKKFQRQYPEDDVSCFMRAGAPKFDQDALVRQKENYVESPRIGNLVVERMGVKFRLGQDGYLRIYRDPSPRRHYIVPADIAEGEDPEKGAFNAAHVIDVESFEQVAVWHGRIPAIDFARELIALGQFYNWAQIAPERNNPGSVLVGYVAENYDNLYAMDTYDPTRDYKMSSRWGWQTNERTKPRMIEELDRVLRDDSIILHDGETIEQCLAYQRLGGRKTGPPRGGYDDLVMALAVGVMVRSETIWEVLPQSAPDVAKARDAADRSGRPFALDHEDGVVDNPAAKVIGY